MVKSFGGRGSTSDLAGGAYSAVFTSLSTASIL